MVNIKPIAKKDDRPPQSAMEVQLSAAYVSGEKSHTDPSLPSTLLLLPPTTHHLLSSYPPAQFPSDQSFIYHSAEPPLTSSLPHHDQ